MYLKAATIIFSIVLTNWIYAESLLFVPEIKPVYKKVFSVLKIPTHNEWSGIANSKTAISLKKDIAHSVMQTPLKILFPQQYSNSIKNLSPVKFASESECSETCYEYFSFS